jgi:hypothetical protein
MHGLQEEFPIPEEDSYIDEVHTWLELNEDEVWTHQTWGFPEECLVFVCRVSRLACRGS